MKQLKRSLLLGAVAGASLVAFACLYTWTTRPRPASPPALDLPWVEWKGAYHCHTDCSHDGCGSLEELVAVAEARGLDWVWVTDHNTKAAGPDPVYSGDLLILVGNERSLPDGHAVVLGPAGREPILVIPAHPFNPSNPWRAPYPGGPIRTATDQYPGWADSLPLPAAEGVEVWNGDSEWRNDSFPALLAVLLSYPFMGPGAMNALVDRPAENLRLWDAAGNRGVAVGGLDTHGGVAWDRDPKRCIGFPSYRATVGMVSLHFLMNGERSWNPVRDEEALLGALRHRSLYLGFDALAPTDGFRLWAEVDRGEGWEAAGGVGDTVWIPAGAPSEKLRLRAELPRGPRAGITLIRDGVVAEVVDGPSLTHEISVPGIYRLEAHLERRELIRVRRRPWVLTNPIRVEPIP
jgi:hypothetical protein